MSEPAIQPHKVRSPIQLLAVWFAALVLIEAAFLASAAMIGNPAWLAPTLVIAAIAFVIQENATPARRIAPLTTAALMEPAIMGKPARHACKTAQSVQTKSVALGFYIPEIAVLTVIALHHKHA